MALSVDSATKTSSVVLICFFGARMWSSKCLGRDRIKYMYVLVVVPVSVMLALLIYVDVPVVLVTVISLGARLLPYLLCLLWLLRGLRFSCCLGICKRELASQSIR